MYVTHGSLFDTEDAILIDAVAQGSEVPLVYIAPEYRRRGVAGQLIEFIENLCQRPKLFSSTNLSNAPMHALFARLGYSACGTVTALDENDPEVFYVKRVKP